MADNQPAHPDEPRGFGSHTRGLAGEYAHEQGWGLEEEQRTKVPDTPQDTDGGTNYEYGARDFGDEPVNAARVLGTSDPVIPAPDAAVPQKESGKQQGDPLDSDPDTLQPSPDPLPAPDDNRHPHSPVAP